MLTPDQGEVLDLAANVPWTNDLPALRRTLLAAGMAKAVADPIKRADFLIDRNLWLEMADGIELHDRGKFEGINGGRTKGPINKNHH